MQPKYTQWPFGGNGLFVQFRNKGWWMIRHTESRYVTLTPPPTLPNAHRVRIMVPVTHPMGLELDTTRPFTGTIMGNGHDQNRNVSVDFEVKAYHHDTEKWTAFALWVAELINNPAQFYNEAD
jgi:hypothetical protein